MDGIRRIVCAMSRKRDTLQSTFSAIKLSRLFVFSELTMQGGNDYEIYHDKRVTGHAVNDPDDTMRQLKELFPL
jgi:phosphomannomutase